MFSSRAWNFNLASQTRPRLNNEDAKEDRL
jgi:hypothetical protein